MSNAGGTLMGSHKDLLSVEFLVKLRPLGRCLSSCWIGTAQIQVRREADGDLEIHIILHLVFLDPGNLLLVILCVCACVHVCACACTSRKERLVAILLSLGQRRIPKSMCWGWIKSFHDRAWHFDLAALTKPFLCQRPFYLVLKRTLYNFNFLYLSNTMQGKCPSTISEPPFTPSPIPDILATSVCLLCHKWPGQNCLLQDGFISVVLYNYIFLLRYIASFQ